MILSVASVAGITLASDDRVAIYGEFIGSDPYLSGDARIGHIDSHEQNAAQHQYGAQHDRDIGQVDDVGTQSAPVEVDEIDHVSPGDSIQQIAETAAAETAKSCQQHGFEPGIYEQKKHDSAQKKSNTHSDEIPAPPRRKQSLKRELRVPVHGEVQSQKAARNR